MYKLKRLAIVLVLILAFCCCMTACDKGQDNGGTNGNGNNGDIVEGGTDENALSGAGLLNTPYLIADKDDIIEFASKVGNYSTVDGKPAYVKLANDIDLGGMALSPIGSNGTTFGGNFDGANHIISNFTLVSAGQDNVGFFAKTAEATTISNLTLSGVKINSAENHNSVGALVAESNSKIINCKVTADINLTGDANAVGGVVGYAFAEVKDVVSNGTMKVTIAEKRQSPDDLYNGGYPAYAGVVAEMQNNEGVSNVTNNMALAFTLKTISDLTTNDVTITVGGIIAKVTNCTATYSNLVNNASIKGIGVVGGIIGDYNGNGATLTNSTNNGDIYATGGFGVSLGGIVAKSTSNVSNKITNCLSVGDMTLSSLLYDNGVNVYASPYTAWCGGILGTGTTTLESCKVSGNISVTGDMNTWVGGIAGGTGGLVANSYSVGNITADVGGRIFVGGIASILENSPTTEIRSCYYAGNAIAKSSNVKVDYMVRVGGVMAYNHKASGNKIANNYFDTTVVANSAVEDTFTKVDKWYTTDADGKTTTIVEEGIINNGGVATANLQGVVVKGFTTTADGGVWVFAYGAYPKLAWEK